MTAIIYPLLDTAVCSARGFDLLALADACLRGGARILQLRAKDESSARVTEFADRLVAAARPFGARIVINDRADIALMSGADGVHVGQTDLPVDAVRAMLGRDRIVGVSTHDREQIDRALATSASYVAVGPVFATTTKDTGYEPRGLDLVRYAAGRGTPIVAIGGITLERAPDVIAAGASALAVITDIFAGGDVEARVRAYCARLPAQSFRV
ncbi:MAG TPA: thiamine phosphate synthase [Vicinamibacterales bacterium]|nr:thiamine phosphate synthase [Vicinamibacterales bacterium]